ncbi:MAG TPA: 2-dehydropantoate 2-reductase, partial [Thermomicrobiales bacterium]|nr:2-dehydropantoate 2-reductase [Thermomicrobiales bacterium]
MAAGAVGGYFGARLAAAGHDVIFIARGVHRDAIRASGLRVDSVLGDLTIKPATVTDDPKTVGPVDVVLFAVKLWDSEAAGELCRPLIGPRTRIITLQNGVDSVERLAPMLGADTVVGGIAYIATVIAAPGVISHTSQFARMRCGRIDGKSDAPLASFAEAARAAGIDIAVSDAINRDRWEKFVFLVGLSGITAAARTPIGPLRADPDSRALFHDLMREVVAVGRASGVDLPADFADAQLKFGDGVPETMKASMAHDLERGHRLELDWLAGKVVALGRKLGVPTPANAAVYAVLKPWRMGA